MRTIFSLIPRVRVNYSLKDVLCATFVSEKSEKYSQRLTKVISTLFGSQNIFLTPSGRAGLYYLLRSYPQRKVIIPAYTCSAVAQACELAGKQIVYVECSPEDFNLLPGEVEKVIDQDSILLATHQYGVPCDILSLKEICERRGAVLLEDAAASIGSRVNGQLIGTFGEGAAFSFDSTKIINVPLKGGFVVVRDPQRLLTLQSDLEHQANSMTRIAKTRLIVLGFAMALLKHPAIYALFHAVVLSRIISEEYEERRPDMRFYFTRMANWQSYIALRQFDCFDEIVAARQRNYQTLYELLSVAGAALLLPPRDCKKEWVCSRFTVRPRRNKLDFYRACISKGVDLGFSFSRLTSPQEFPISHAQATTVLNVPSYFSLSQAELKLCAFAVLESTKSNPSTE